MGEGELEKKWFQIKSPIKTSNWRRQSLAIELCLSVKRGLGVPIWHLLSSARVLGDGSLVSFPDPRYGTHVSMGTRLMAIYTQKEKKWLPLLMKH